MWTPERVREELPDIGLRLPDNGAIMAGRVTGRRNPYATVWPPRGYIGVTIGLAGPWNVSWATVAHCLNHKRPVRI